MGTFLPFRAYNTDNQLIIDTIFVLHYYAAKLEGVFELYWKI